MPGPMTKSVDSPALTEKEIIEWLRAHPRFLQDNPAVCDLLLPPTEKKGKGIADFQAYMIQRLKEDKEDVIESARELVENSRHNMHNQSRIQRAVVLLLEAHNFEDFVRTITLDFAALLDVDIVSLIVETEGEVIPHIDLAGVRLVSPGTVDLLLGGHPVALEGATVGLDQLYGGGSTLVKSQALLRLNIGAGSPPAMLAFGSRDANLFYPGQGTEMVSFLGHVVERCFRLWLTLPR
ncbi:MAG: DUF484 family protein [Alphaproteobacteria bacterium]|nr:DUF484 family protein [Alphaproteobacteria bacterium]MBU0858457.1 DUF484 family protein [Alphaproteobacteria bacterium]